MKFSLIKLQAALVLQFLENAPYTNTTYKAEDGSTVSINSGFPAVAFGALTKDGKTTYSVNVFAPTGPNTFKPVVIETGDNETRDKLAELLKNGLTHKEVVDTTPVVVVPEGDEG